LPSLELRRLHLDLVFCYKIVFCLVPVKLDDFIEIRSISRTRGHAYKLYMRTIQDVDFSSFMKCS